MKEAVLVMLGGSLGALSRYLVALATVACLGTGFPWGTLLVNLGGCFFIGLAMSLAERSFIVGPSVRVFFVTGYLGALTTFSTYAMESVAAAKAGMFRLVLVNVVLNNLVGVVLVLVGWRVGRWL